MTARGAQALCPDCGGTGMVEAGARPDCTCPVHTYGNAECSCGCAHVGEDCGFCDATGALHPPRGAR